MKKGTGKSAPFFFFVVMRFDFRPDRFLSFLFLSRRRP